MFGWGSKSSAPEPAPAYSLDLGSESNAAHTDQFTSSQSFSQSSASEDAELQVFKAKPKIYLL